MASINYIPRIYHARRMNLACFLTPDDAYSSFAIFGGTEEERRAAAILGIARGCGTMGVVVLHNDVLLERQLGRLHAIKPGDYHIYCANSDRRAYDPLYGLEELDVLDSIAPYDVASAAAPTMAKTRSTLSDYLEIMRWNFEQGMDGFGAYPFNLNLLLDLVAKPYVELKQQVLDYLPQSMRERLKNHLSADGVQQLVLDNVINFTVRMEAYLYSRQNEWKNHTRFSIVSVVRGRQVISLRIPNSDRELLRYCAAELNCLNRCGVPFLVVCCNLRVNENPFLERVFLDAKSGMATGLVAPTVNAAVGDDRLDNIMKLNRQMVLFPCSSTDEAEPFSRAVGNYYRVIYPEHRERHRRLFHLIPEVSNGVGYLENEIRSIRPEDLQNMSLLAGETIDAPMLVDDLHW